MGNATVKIEDLNEAIKNVLQEYNSAVVKELKSKTEEAMSELVATTKATAPVGKRRRHYRSNITSRVVSDDIYGLTMMWYVKGSDYRLTHLLNNGHALRNGGRYEGTNFLGKAVDDITVKYIQMVEEALKNG